MSYSLDVLTTTADCDAMISIAQKEKGTLTYRKTTLEWQQANFNENSGDVDQELPAILTEIDFLKAAIATMADGPAKEDKKDKLRKAESRKYTLSKKDKTYGNLALLSLQLEIARVQKEMDEVDIFTQNVTTKKATL
jgi:hypothetical protein